MTSLSYTAIAQTNQPTNQQTPTTRPATPSNSTQLSDFDRAFVTQAAQSNLAEVELSQVALKQASSDQVRQYAQHMIDEHTKANARLMQLLKQNGITLVRPQLDAKHQAIRAQLVQLTGQQFDQQYMDVMREDHVVTVALFQQAAQKLQHPDLRAFAKNTLPNLQNHLQMAQAMTGNNAAGNQNTPSR
ncbi:MAG TPA: DUF4142 domain-containing protein [Coleofasciculaceae cyanobacterium]